MPSRVVITGLGLTSSLGRNREELIQSFESKRTAFAQSSLLPCVVCPDDDPGDDKAGKQLQGWRYRRYLSRAGYLGVLAGLRAVLDSGYAFLPQGTGIIGTAAPTLDFTRERGLPPADSLDLDALWLLRWLPNTPVSALSILLGVHGEGLTVGSACASGLMALGEAWFRIRYGRMQTCLVVAGDSRLCLGGLLGYSKAHTISSCQDPAMASRPFDQERTGFVPGEGGAAFLLEEREHALARGANILCEILGYGASLDGAGLTAPDPDGKYAEQAVRQCLETASCSLLQVDWVSAHGTGTKANDVAEAMMLRRLFSERKNGPAVTALKSWLGHCSAASGAVELACLLSACSKGFLPPVLALEHPVAELDFVRKETRLLPVPSVGLVESFGFGGQNAALLVRAGDCAL